MAASINDKLIEAENGSNPQPTTVSSARSIGGTSLSCVALTNWPTATSVHLITYKKKTDGTMDRDTLCLWKGIVSGTTIGTLTLKGGTDAGNSVGDFVEMAPTSAQWQDLYDGLTQTLNVDGTLKDNIVTTAKIAAKAVDSNTLADSAVKANNMTNTVRSTPYAQATNIGTSFAPLYTATKLCLVTVYNDYKSGAFDTSFGINGAELGYASPQRARSNWSCILNPGDVLSIRALTAYTSGWTQVNVSTIGS